MLLSTARNLVARPRGLSVGNAVRVLTPQFCRVVKFLLTSDQLRAPLALMGRGFIHWNSTRGIYVTLDSTEV